MLNVQYFDIYVNIMIFVVHSYSQQVADNEVFVCLPFVAFDESIPRTRSQWIDVNTCARTCRSHHKPPVRRASLFTSIFKEIVSEIDGDIIIVQQLFATGVLKNKNASI